jgi:pimeloyl-ACP methyl ester carboxylesterase
VIPKSVVLPNGFKVSYLHGGGGIPLVFMHGFSVSAVAYGELLDLLAGNGFEVWAFDAPDHGGTDNLPYGHSVEDMADVLADAMDHIGIPPSVMVGHSMGGAIVAEFSAKRPDSVIDAVLLDAAVGESHHRSISASRGAQFFSGAVRDVWGDVRQAGSIRRLGERLSLASRLQGSVSGVGMARAGLALVKHDSTAAMLALKHHRVRTTLIHGSEDRIVSPVAAMDAALLAGARLCLLGGRFHSWMISDPRVALDWIRDAIGLDYDFGIA